MLVVFSAAVGYLLGLKGPLDWNILLLVLTGGTLVTASSNGFNQVIERDTDKLMNRTSGRPLPAGRMSVSEGIISSLLMGTAGVLLLWIYINPLTGFLSLISLLLYTLLYTPLKKIT